MAQKWEVTLTSGQIHSPVKLDTLQGDSLRFFKKSNTILVSLDVLSRIKALNTWRLRLWGLGGGLCGLSCGYVVGRVFGSIFDLPLKQTEDPVVLFPTATGVVLGVVLGLDHADELDRGKPLPDHDFSQMTREEKVTTLRKILQRE